MGHEAHPGLGELEARVAQAARRREEQEGPWPLFPESPLVPLPLPPAGSALPKLSEEQTATAAELEEGEVLEEEQTEIDGGAMPMERG